MECNQDGVREPDVRSPADSDLQSVKRSTSSPSRSQTETRWSQRGRWRPAGRDESERGSIQAAAGVPYPPTQMRPVLPSLSLYFDSRTTKSGEGAAKPAVTAYSTLPNAARVVGTFVDGFDVNGSVMKPTIAPER